MNERWERIGDCVRRRRAENPGPMTLDGTNSYVVAAPGAPGVVVVDPGPALEPHLAELAAAGAVELILITHHHGDHTDGSASLHQLTGAPVRAALAAFCHAGEPLSDGEIIDVAGLAITVLATPGHTSDSLCFAVAPLVPLVPPVPLALRVRLVPLVQQARLVLPVQREQRVQLVQQAQQVRLGQTAQLVPPVPLASQALLARRVQLARPEQPALTGRTVRTVQWAQTVPVPMRSP